jgi:phosphoenolpyruvate carboxykinase (ATP)
VGEVNKPFEEDRFVAILARIQSYLQGPDVFVQDVYAGADPEHRVAVRVVTQFAWHSLFARNMFIRERNLDRVAEFAPEWNLIYVPNFSAVPDQDSTRSEVFALIDFGRKLILIGGTQYAGEIKKAVFTVLNYILPKKGIMGMHCSASMNEKGETALFFGLSGTGKTTLSASSQFTLISDDEHGWSDRGVFNFEGGCYAKVIRLDATAEPEIYSMTRRFGTILENVIIEPESRRVDLNSESFTENTRASYPIGYLSNATFRGLGDHPPPILSCSPATPLGSCRR